MKVGKKILVGFATLSLGLGAGMMLYAWNPFSRSDWEDAGRSMRDAAQSAARAAQNAAESAARAARDAAESAARAAQRAAEEAGRFAAEQAATVANFIAGSQFGKLVAMATDKVFSEMGFHLKDFVNSIIHAKDAGSSIGGSINNLQQKIQSPEGPLKKVEVIITLAKSFEPKVKELVKAVEPDKIKGALSDPSQIPALMVMLGSQLAKTFDELKTIHDQILQTIDSTQVAPILQEARNVLSNLVTLLNSIIEARNATGKLGELFLATDTRDALQHISNDLTGIASAIEKIQKAGIQSASDIERSILSGLFTHLDRIMPVANQIMDRVGTIQKLVDAFGPNISKIQSEIAIISSTANKIPDNINERLKREMKSAQSIAISIVSLGTGAVVQAAVYAGYSLNDSINEIKGNLRNILQEVSAMLGSVSDIIGQATPILLVFKDDLGINFVPPATVDALNEIGRHLNAMANHIQELKKALGGTAQVISPLDVPAPVAPPVAPRPGGFLAARSDIVNMPQYAQGEWVRCNINEAEKNAVCSVFCSNLGKHSKTAPYTAWKNFDTTNPANTMCNPANGLNCFCQP